ncbi:putative garp [Cryptosporidium sp. chipmunk genotype I]|uniref:putative garp n=1 Tax=Cryptosporidium sp. chipmunk genotype I TaxID=1280935 RepID=UPI00351A4EE3|nr:putative garp [Cryptosporidium sp. chipmunk genotype I]
MKVLNFLLPIIFTLALYSQSIYASENEPLLSTGKKGLTQERIQHFEKIIKENKEKTIPQLKVVRRSKPLISKFPIEEGSLSTRVDQYGELSDDNYVEPHDEITSTEGSDYPSSYIGPISSDIEDQSDLEDNENIIEIKDIEDSKALEDEISSDINKDVEYEDTGNSNGDLSVSVDTKTDLSSTNQEEKSDNIPASTLGLSKSQKKKLEKERLKLEKKEKKLRKQNEKERLKQEKQEKKRREKEEKIKLKDEKNRLKLEKEQIKNKKKHLKKDKLTTVPMHDLNEETEKKSSCSSKKKKHKSASAQVYDETLEERLNNQVVSEVSEDVNDEVSTTASENEAFDQLSSIDEAVNFENEDDIKVEKPREEHLEFDDEEEESEIKARILAGNENDFKTERFSSEEVLQDSDSDYLEGDENLGETSDKYRFSEESEDLISKERAVKPLEGIEIEGLSEGEDEDVSNVSDAPAMSGYSGDNEEENENLNIQDLSSGIELSNDNENLSEDQVQAANSMDNEEIGIEEEKNIDEEFPIKDSKIDEGESENKVKSFFGKIKSFFKKKPSINFNCKSPACMKRFSKKDEPKYSSDFIPRIYLLSRSIPKENFYRVPEIISSLRSESNRLVFAYQLIDGSLIPSSSLALNSKSFIVRRWGKKVQSKLTNLRSEFDSLKTRLSSMYHEGVIKGEFELFIEEMDDLTIMLYLLAKEFPSKSKFASIAKDILRYPEVVSTPGERLVSMFRKSKISKCSKKTNEPKLERSEGDKLAIKALRKRMKFIKKRLNSLGK